MHGSQWGLFQNVYEPVTTLSVSLEPAMVEEFTPQKSGNVTNQGLVFPRKRERVCVCVIKPLSAHPWKKICKNVGKVKGSRVG